MPRFKNLLEDCHCYHPSGHPASALVANGQLVEVPGQVVEETEDCWVVENDGDTRAWPKVRWSLEDKPSPKKSASVSAMVSAEVAEA